MQRPSLLSQSRTTYNTSINKKPKIVLFHHSCDALVECTHCVNNWDRTSVAFPWTLKSPEKLVGPSASSRQTMEILHRGDPRLPFNHNVCNPTSNSIRSLRRGQQFSFLSRPRSPGRWPRFSSPPPLQLPSVWRSDAITSFSVWIRKCFRSCSKCPLSLLFLSFSSNPALLLLD